MPLVPGPVSMNVTTLNASNFPLVEADRCVLCGLCLPHCPTYRVTQDENESPRGRVSLMRAVATGALLKSEKIAGHLSLCMACRACERICPSGVHYGELIEAGRVHVQAQELPWLARFGLRLLGHPHILGKIGVVARLYQQSGLQRLMRMSGILRWLGLRRLESLLPPVSGAQSWRAFYPARGKKVGRIALFLGCVARVLDSHSIAAAIRLLTRLGYEVVVPASQTCCGALHRDAGHAVTARRLAARNQAAFDPNQNDNLANVDAIISVVSGCTSALATHLHSTAPVKDINQFLAHLPLPTTLRLAPLETTVAVHDPCSLRSALHAEQSVYTLLRRIPQLQVLALPENHLCCGGAGTYPLRQPAMADRLRAEKLIHLKQLQPAILVTANIGCALHFAAGLRGWGTRMEVIHPIVLFERQLQDITA